jgi:glycogen operon protein
MATRISGSPDFFDRRGRRPRASVNFVTAHDGFTLNDLVSYNDKHNEANGEEHRDGTSNNFSWNCGAEGPTKDPGVRKLRERQKRNMLATLLLSQGTPMMLAGDEFGRTQRGNNNAYCQDNEISWFDWGATDENGRALTRFLQRLTTLRSAFPVLRRGRFLTAELNDALGVREVIWINASGEEMQDDQWNDSNMRCFGMVLDGRAQSTGIKRAASDATLLMVMNAHHDLVQFTLPEVNGGHRWLCLIDTNVPEREDLPAFENGYKYGATGRSLLLFALETGADSGRALRRVLVELSPSVS